MAYNIKVDGVNISLNLYAFNSTYFPSSGGDYSVSTTESNQYPTATNYYYNGSRLYCNYGASSGSTTATTTVSLSGKSAAIGYVMAAEDSVTYYPATASTTFSLGEIQSVEIKSPLGATASFSGTTITARTTITEPLTRVTFKVLVTYIPN